MFHHPLITLDTMFFIFSGLAILGLLWFRKQSSITTVLRAGKKVSPTYWGTYDSVKESKNKTESESVTLPKILPQQVVVIAGSNKYSKGKPVKTLRS